MFRYRAVFRKSGKARYLSHLDLNRSFGRAFRRAGIRLKYTQGFNPKPILAFTPALALGVEGLQEAVDFQLGEPTAPELLVRRLNGVLPEGIVVITIDHAKKSDPSLSADVTAARYRVTLPLLLEVAPLRPGRKGSGSVETMPFNEESGLRDDEKSRGGTSGPDAPPEDPATVTPVGGDAEWHRAHVEEFNGSGTRSIGKTRKGRVVQVDLKEFVGRISLIDMPDVDGVTLAFPVKFRNGATVRPEEVLTGIYGFVPRGCSIVREGLQFGALPVSPGLEPHAAPAAPAAG